MAAELEMPCGKSTVIRGLNSGNVQWLSPEDDVRWDAFVSAHPLGLVYHLSAWKRVLEDAFPHIRGRFLALRDAKTGEIQAGLPVYAVKSWLLGNRTVSIPFASFCDPLVSTAEEFQLLLTQIHDFAKRSKSRKIEIRSMRMAEQCAASFLNPITEFKHHYLNLDTSTDALYASFAKSSVCQKVSRAHRSGVVVEERFDEESLRICHSIVVDTRRRLSLPTMPFLFFESMKRTLGRDHLRIFLASHEGKYVACHLVLLFKDQWISEFSGNTDSAIHGVNQLLYWETIRCAHASGAKWFSFGRTASSNNGLLEYKRRWATVEEDLIYFNRVLAQTSTTADATERSRGSSGRVPVAKWLIGKAPTSVYHWIGNFCYRHLG
jgi:hypothetical protein